MSRYVPIYVCKCVYIKSLGVMMDFKMSVCVYVHAYMCAGTNSVRVSARVCVCVRASICVRTCRPLYARVCMRSVCARARKCAYFCVCARVSKNIPNNHIMCVTCVCLYGEGGMCVGGSKNIPNNHIMFACFDS